MLKNTLSLLLFTVMTSFLFSCKEKKIVTTTPPADAKSKLIQGRWSCVGMARDGKVVDFKKAVGDVMVKFQEDKFTMSMAGDERSFTFFIQGDSLKFSDTNEYPPFKIYELDKTHLKMDQYYPEQDFKILWDFAPYQK